jgi:hypothetical protein
MSRNHSRTPPPRQLTANETLESLTHWQTTFRTFYKRDDTYKIFFKKDLTWNYLRPNYNLNDEVGGEERKADELSEDLQDLLNTLAGYLPHSYLTDKILKSTSFADIWKIIRDHYNVQVTSESLLDFESLHKLPEETHRQFYERLLQHGKQHLAPAKSKVDNFTNVVDDVMTISFMNMVALQWLRKYNIALIEIVKTEYSTELRSNVQLADLVPHIAPNIDSLLRRYDQGVTSNKVNTAASQETDDAQNVSKTFSKGGAGFGSTPKFRGGGSSQSRGNGPLRVRGGGRQ